jgi:hypothetical protein
METLIADAKVVNSILKLKESCISVIKTATPNMPGVAESIHF